MQEEIKSLKENVFELTHFSEGKKTIIQFTTEENPDGSERYKAKYVANGFSQTKRLDNKEISSTNITSIRLFRKRVMQNNLTVHQMNVTTAYLYVSINFENFVKQSEVFEVKKK